MWIMMYYLMYLSELKYTEQEWKKIRIDEDNFCYESFNSFQISDCYQRKIRSLKIVIYLIISREDDRDWAIFA